MSPAEPARQHLQQECVGSVLSFCCPALGISLPGHSLATLHSGPVKHPTNPRVLTLRKPVTEKDTNYLLCFSDC